MAINRFSKEVRPAEFNPLTADEIMRVPLLKGQMEQEQLQMIEDKRLEMMNVDVAPGDMERVRQAQSELSGQFDGLVDQITKEGVGHRSTDAVNKFMKEYNNKTSKTGIIGNAAVFAGDRKAKRAEDRKLAIARGYDMSQWDKLYSAHEARQSSVNGVGELTSEFKNLNMPTHIDPKKMFRDLIKGKLGSTKQGTTLGDFQASNQHQLTAAVDQVMNKYYTDPDFKQIMDDLGYTEEDIQRQISNEATIALEQAFVDYQQAPLTAAQKAAASTKAKKAEDEANAEAARRGETILSEHTEGITEASSMKTDQGALEDLKTIAESENATEAQKNEYLRAVSNNSQVEEAFLQDPTGANTKAGLDLAIKTFTEGDTRVEPLYEGDYEGAQIAAAELNKETIAKQQSGYQTQYGVSGGQTTDLNKNEEINSVIVQKEDGSFAVYDKGDARIEALAVAKEQYDAAYEQFSGPNSLHTQRTFFSPTSARGTGKGTNNDATVKIKKDLHKIIAGPSGDSQVTQMSKSYQKTPTSDNEFGEQVDIPMDLNSDDAARTARNILNGVKEKDISDIKFALATDSKPGAIKVTFTRNELTEDSGNTKVPVTYTATLDMNGGDTSEWGILLREGLAAGDTYQTNKLIATNKEVQEQKGVIATPSNTKTYINSAPIKDYIKGGNVGRKILAETMNDETNVYSKDGKFSIRTAKSSGGADDYTITNANILKGMYIDNLEQLGQSNKPLAQYLLSTYSEESERPMNSFTLDDPDLGVWLKNMQYGDKSFEHFKANSKSQLLNILKY